MKTTGNLSVEAVMGEDEDFTEKEAKFRESRDRKTSPTLKLL
jgi:hypothetical protein